VSKVISEKTILEVIELLKNRGVYDLMCSLRGPDDTGMINLKYLFTARIRAILGIEEPGVARRETREVEWQWVKSALEEMVEAQQWTVVEHYLGHVQRALAVLANIDKLRGEAEGLLRLASELEHAAVNVRFKWFSLDRELEELRKMCRELGFVKFEEGEG